mmetsp:Transcript_35959/g.76761  ORF Transcript_35959/g.76761 Transcript_35959/m.76761 type:complete len:284 (-) Transcript_35959:153-1004(-)
MKRVNPTIANCCSTARNNHAEGFQSIGPRGINFTIIALENEIHHTRNVMPRVGFASEVKRAFHCPCRGRLIGGRGGRKKLIPMKEEELLQEIVEVPIHFEVIFAIPFLLCKTQASSDRLIDIHSPRCGIVPAVRIDIDRPTAGPGLQSEGTILQPQPIHGTAPRTAVYPQNEGNLARHVVRALSRLEQPIEYLLVRTVVGRREVTGPVPRGERAVGQERERRHEVRVGIGVAAGGAARRSGERRHIAAIVVVGQPTADGDGGSVFVVRQTAHPVSGAYYGHEE